MAASLSEIAQVKEMLGQPREAEQSYRQALKLRREIGDKSGIGSTLTNLAALLNETLGHPNDALPLLQEALQIRRDTGNASGEALVLNNIGVIYMATGKYSDAQTNFERALQLRERANVPREMADTLHNLAETLLKMGRYDQSLTRYVSALDLRRKSGDKRGAAIESYSIGTIFDYQGRYGAALKSKGEALATFRDLKQRDMWLGEILGGYGNSLSLSGRFDDAAKSLEEALSVGRELQNPSVIAQTLRFKADRLYYSGDDKGASQSAQEAVQAASRASDRSLALLAQSSVATTAVATQPTRRLVAQLATLAQEADTLGLKFLSVDCSLLKVDALLKLRDYAGARQEADRTLAKSDALGLRLLVAKARYLRATALRLTADPEATRDYAYVVRVLEEIKGEDGNQNVLKRADLSAIHAESLRWSKVG
jgi:tetratricopeptide (TPR) repeat protein